MSLSLRKLALALLEPSGRSASAIKGLCLGVDQLAFAL
jgi:hypothetical protein